MNVKRSRIRTTKWYEWLILAVIAVFLIALLIPGEKWASDGTIEVTVHVVVFDLETNEPVENASVAIVRTPPNSSDSASGDSNELIAETWNNLRSGNIGVNTDSSGSVLINQQFRTGATHIHPEPRAHTRWYWVLVSAEDYGGTAIPLRYDAVTLESLREQAALPVYVGLAQRHLDSE